jgi:aminoglycoside phosphotransferase (APT) family kinase protein
LLKADITAAVVSRLVKSQFPQWADLPVTAVALDGWDNTTFRLGSTLSVRLPSHDSYVPQIDKEQQWLPRLAPHLPLPIPEPVAKGQPSQEFTRPWSIYRWIAGATASVDRINDLDGFAAELADFLAALYRCDAQGGPPSGAHSFYRGGPLSVWDEQTRQALLALSDSIDADAAGAVWEAALAGDHHDPAVWVHGDVSGSNLLVADGHLAAVIDFGCSAVGDPACDTTVAWTLFKDRSRETFMSQLPLGDATWARGRGWALWKALITLRADVDFPGYAAQAAHRFGWRWHPADVVNEVIGDSRRLS